MVEKVILSRKSPEVIERLALLEFERRKAEVVTLREWYESTNNHAPEIGLYIEKYKQLGRLGKELHRRGVPRITERYSDSIRTLVEATYKREILDFAAPLCALACLK